MRLITRNDTSLAVGLIVGAIVVFQQPFHFLLDVARDIEVRYHLDLLPAVIIMTGVFVFQQYGKRQVAKADARAAAAEAVQARNRSEELGRLMTFSQALANVLDLSTLQQVLSRYLPTFAREYDFWVLTRNRDGWEEVLQDTTRTKKRALEALASIADHALSGGPLSESHVEGISSGDAVCFPMLAGGVAVGIVGIHDGTGLARDDRKALGAATALIAIALRNVQLFRETREHSLRDGLTGCINRGHGLEVLDSELRRARRSGGPLSILMVDIDHFKTINDELGHLRGDEVLRAVGAQLTRVLRTSDVRCRYGGDEFLIILPDTHVIGAEQVAEHVRREIGTLAIADGERVISVTASVGVAAAAPAELDVSALIERTDDALYQAKRAGRNRFCVAVPPGLPSSSEPRIEPGAATSRPATAYTGAETILVAEDEPFVRDLIGRALEPCGYTILSATNAAEAIAMAEGHGGPIHLLLSDVIMPDLNGPDLAARIRRHRPNIKVLYISGFVDHAAVELASLNRETAFLQKPFTSDALAMKVRQQLDVADRDAGPRTVLPVRDNSAA